MIMKSCLIIGIFLILNAVSCFKEPSLKFKELREKYENKKSNNLFSYVTKNGETYELKKASSKIKLEPNDWVVQSLWNGADYNQTGWSILEIETNENFKDTDQAYAAGFLEGFVTKDLISLQLLNEVGDSCKNTSDPLCTQLIQFLDQNMNWMNEQIEKNVNDPYWHHVNLVLTQFFGLIVGYQTQYTTPFYTNPKQAVENMFKKSVTDYLPFLFLQLAGDLEDLEAKFQGASNPFMAGSCSALIKVLDNNTDLYVSHDTWSGFDSMLRVLKHYKFNYHLNDIDAAVVPGNELVFSSYPGTILSIDDFYISSSRLVIIETTIGNSNASLWANVQPQSNLYWIRNLVSHRLSFRGIDWVKWFTPYNSGTYNNQWMIVDYNLYTPGQPLKDNLFIVLEQIPGLIIWQDQTSHLRNYSYWSSYNIPFYPFIYNLSGVYDAYLQYGDIFSYDQCSRAKIFRRDQPNVHDINSMIKLMRYNDYTRDPFSRCDKCNPPYSAELIISARCDLNPINGTYPVDFLGHREHGGIDMKLTTSTMMKTLDFVAIMGPAYGSPNVPPFVWSQSDFNNKVKHFGHPDRFEFDPFYTEWNL